jgi:hypothetical protein
MQVTWPWFFQMAIIIKGSTKGKVAPKEVYQGNGVEKDEDVLLEFQPFLFIPINDCEARNVPTFKLVITTKYNKNFLPFIPIVQLVNYLMS